MVASNETWRDLSEADWLEAFRSHPRIGESHSEGAIEERRSIQWASQEQSGVANTDDAVKLTLAKANREYEKRFGRIFIVCATDKSAAEILEILNRRLGNDATTELREAAEQQLRITNIRLKKWLSKR